MAESRRMGGTGDAPSSGVATSEEAAALIAMVRRLSVARSLSDVMQVVTQSARALLGSGGITFVLRENDLCYYAEENAISPLWKGCRFSMDACISGWCMIERQAVAIRDIYLDPRIPHEAYRPTFVRSLAMVPLPQEEPIAAMGAYWPDIHDVSPEEMVLLQTIGNAAALAIANVELRQEHDTWDGQRKELFHRIKNIFTTALTLARRTEGASPDAIRSALVGRLRALEKVHAALWDARTDTADLATLLRDLLAPLVQEAGGTLAVEGPPVLLHGSCATQLAIVIHELGTNAVKYGALSAPTGGVEIRWQYDEPDLRLRWQETGVTVAQPATQKGFGTRLVEGIVSYQLAGHAEFRYEPDGLCCNLSVRLPR